MNIGGIFCYIFGSLLFCRAAEYKLEIKRWQEIEFMKNDNHKLANFFYEISQICLPIIIVKLSKTCRVFVCQKILEKKKNKQKRKENNQNDGILSKFSRVSEILSLPFQSESKFCNKKDKLKIFEKYLEN